MSGLLSGSRLRQNGPGMQIETVAILSPGDMGHATGQVLKQGGLRVVTCLQGRSERTRRLALKAGIEDVPDLRALVQQSDLIFSIVAPAHARGLAQELAEAIRVTAASPLCADCNAIAPQAVREIAQ